VRRDKRRIEVSTSGIDEALQGLTSDSIGFALPQATGLRVPPVLPGYTTPLAQPRYRFCLATRTITNGATRLRGIRQGVTLGVDANAGSPPERPVEMTVTTPTFHFPDGNIAWYLVTESNGHRVVRAPSTNAPGWSYIETEGAAMLYNSFTNTAVDPVTGAPRYYFQNMTAYTAPKTPNDWLAIAELGCFHDLRFPWNSSTAWDSVDEIIEGTARISLYADVLQTNPATRNVLTPPSTWRLPAATPEEAFILDWTTSGEGPTLGPIYWRIYGALIFEDDISPPDRDARELTKAEFT
jgi:hypothetical protein